MTPKVTLQKNGPDTLKVQEFSHLSLLNYLQSFRHSDIRISRETVQDLSYSLVTVINGSLDGTASVLNPFTLGKYLIITLLKCGKPHIKVIRRT